MPLQLISALDVFNRLDQTAFEKFVADINDSLADGEYAANNICGNAQDANYLFHFNGRMSEEMFDQFVALAKPARWGGVQASVNEDRGQITTAVRLFRNPVENRFDSGEA